MLKKIPVSALRTGMYVVSLDCSWLDTPFLRHRFMLESADQLATLRRCCRRVTIDTDKGVSSAPEVTTAVDHPRDTETPVAPPPTVPPVSAAVESPPVAPPTPAQQQRIYRESLAALTLLFEDVRLGRSLDTRGARDVVRSLAASVVSDSHAMIYLAQLTDKGGDLARKSVNVCILTLAFAKHLGIAKRKLHHLGLGALLHDIGMVQLPDELLCTGRTLMPPERCLMQQHTDFGAQLLSQDKDIDRAVLDIVRGHHERIDGQGYPAQLSDRQTSLFARIVAITSVYEALTRERGYKQAFSPTQALREIYQGRYTHFDGRLVEKFIQALGIYPVGCLVETDQGDIARVIAVSEEQRHRPILELMLDRESRPLENIRLDLTDNRHRQTRIKKAVEPQDPRVGQLLDTLIAAHQQAAPQGRRTSKGLSS